MRNLLSALLTFQLALATTTFALAAPPHLLEAERLVAHLDLANTNYEHGQGTVVWGDTPESHTDCSGFIDQLLMHSYHYDAAAFKRWFDSHRPSAARYHDAIEAERGFARIATTVQALRPGDFIAVKYFNHSDNTGHIMLVAEAPQRMAEKKPRIAGSEQWSVTVIDSSESGHGPTDTRHKRGPNGKDHDGLGEGVLRLYANRDGQVTGFAWSTLEKSEFKSPQDEHVVFGRFVAGYRP